MPSCPINIGGGITPVVIDNIGNMQDFANGAFNQTLDLVDRLVNFSIEPVDYNASFNFTSDLTAFVPPSAPTMVIDSSIQYEEPPSPSLVSVTDPTGALTGEPVYDLTAPTLDFGGKPNVSVDDSLPTAPTLLSVDSPTAPTTTVGLPDSVTLDGVVTALTPFTPVEIPIFTDTLGDFTARAPSAAIDFTETEYSSTLLDEVKAKLSSMMAGGTGLPAAIECALFERAASRESQAANQARHQTLTEFAARGFSLPTGALAKRLEQITQQEQDQRATLNRDVMIRTHEVEIEQIRFAVANGIALEGQLINAHMLVMQRAFDAARSGVELAIALFNSQIEEHNLAVRAFATKAQVYGERVRGEIARADTQLTHIRAQIESERLKIDSNAQKIAEYEAVRDKILGEISARISAYNADIQKANLTISNNAQTVDLYRGELQGFAELVRSREVAVRAWAEGVRGELGKVSSFEAQTRAYASRLEGWKTGVDAHIAAADNQVRQNDQAVREFQSREQLASSKLRAQVERVNAQVSEFNALVRLYEAQASVESSRQFANNRTVQIGLEEENNRFNAAIKTAELDVTQFVKNTDQLLEALRTAATVGSNLASSALGAINTSASVSAGSTDSQSCQTSYNYSGDIADA